jgi:alanyl-tRNA synthetase
MLRHVAKTGDIKHFVITEESGIAKGIRRITALTGIEAQRVITLAEGFRARLERVETIEGKDKDTELKALTIVSFCLSF